MEKISLFKKYLKKKTDEQLVDVLFGVPPQELSKTEHFTVHKSSKKGKVSFLITKALLDNLLETSKKINKKPKLIISIPNGKDEYILACELTKKVGE